MIGGYFITILITILIYAILAHSLNIITGHAGQISLGHAAFFGIGAYTSALLYTEAGLSFWVSVPLATAAAGIVGALLGIPCLRVRDDFLAITTMGINFVVEAVFLYIPFFGGAMGIGGMNLPGWFGREMTKPEYFVLIVAVFALLLLLDRKLGRSWIGLAWASIREDEQAAESMGVDVVRFKVLAFILGSAIAGLAGGFYAHFLTFIMPQNFGFPLSIMILSMVVFGGIGTRWGPLLGAVILGILPEVSRPDHGVPDFSLRGSAHVHDAVPARGASGLRVRTGSRLPASRFQTVSSRIMPMPFLEITAIGKEFDGLRALDGVTFTASPARSSGSSGQTGPGRRPSSTSSRGSSRPSAGDILFEGKSILRLKPHQISRIGIGRTFQIVRPFPNLDVETNVLVALGQRFYPSLLHSVQAVRRPEILEEARAIIEESRHPPLRPESGREFAPGD